ncbi:MAG: cbb3-type cytochrome c oxidase subunit 3 [Novosphingobium sp.]|jgi:cytochrome c oxidase cbb3-type subunit 4|nr:cbb3-type cytochrome c oxidase subunit 3 [Novosphingobium sp.]MBP6555062.1 cbb3-type cytochrome c oxidase subunit 3 [Novosphingobium sp.]
MRHFADSWGLALMVLTFLALCAWPFRPSARKSNEAAANMIFAEDSLGGDENGE